MKTFSKIQDVRKYRWAEPAAEWGLVPTMGYLHEGHLSLVRRARAENDRVAVSIFVNPAQFNDANDLAQYPQNLDRDLNLLRKERVDLVWTPPPEEVYPTDFQSYVDVEKVTKPLEGRARPGHFRGVTTVVAKLFNVLEPHRAYFGEKDAQQLLAVKQMARDLNFNLDVVACPTVRETDGLALSSRNANLTPKAREQAASLYQALTVAQRAFDAGQRDAGIIKTQMREVLNSHDLVQVDYVSVANRETLEELRQITEGALISLAVFVDGVRLIDNISVRAS